jgi:hypothetical protein
MPSLHGNQFGNLDSIIFGDGSDGSVTISGSIFLTRDMAYRDLTVKKGVSLYTNGHRIRVKDSLIIEGELGNVGRIANNGANARNSNGRLDELTGSVPVGTVGGPRGTTGGGGRGGAGMYNGGLGAGNVEHPIQSGSVILVPVVDLPSSPVFFLGGAGGRGGDAVFLSGTTPYVYAGGPGSSGSVTVLQGGHHGFFTMSTCGVIGGTSGSGSYNPLAGGAGGGAGACANSGSLGVRPRSGWGGGGGGVVYIAAREVTLNGKIEARGGSGGNTFAKAAGGGGGGGGLVVLIYSKLQGRYDLNTGVDISGGSAGIGQNHPNGTLPAAGTRGRLLYFEV